MLRLTTVFLVCSASLLAAGCSRRRVVMRPAVKGVVFSEDGTYLPGAKVKLMRGMMYGMEVADTQESETDETGHFHFGKLRRPMRDFRPMRPLPGPAGILSMFEVTAKGFGRATFRLDEGSNTFVPSSRSIEDVWMESQGTAATARDTPTDQPRNPRIFLRLTPCGDTKWITPVVLSLCPTKQAPS